MSKAVLVIDMPERCIDCPLCWKQDQYRYRCIIVTDPVEPTKKYKWCPLKEAEERQK